VRADRKRAAALGAGLAALVALSACSAGGDGDGVAEAARRPDATVSLSIGSSGSTEAATTTTSTPPETTVPATTVPPTTEAPTTLPPETMPPTTAPPQTTVPADVIPVPKAAVPIQPVGAASGEATSALQRRLIELDFWVSAVDGQYGLTTRQAVMAFQKYAGLDPTGSVDPTTAMYLTEITERARATDGNANMVEVDKTRQLLFVVQDGLTIWVLNTSTGSGKEYSEVNKNDPTKIETGDSLTRSGSFEVYRERPEGWWEGDLGEIYRPKYFSGGQAIHGSNSIPNYPASHGCVRVSVPAMDMIWASGLVPRGTPVWVHGEDPPIVPLPA
jgi:peptidoglycan hydrolase-like protein with peptidoglycan-binding domain